MAVCSDWQNSSVHINRTLTPLSVLSDSHRVDNVSVTPVYWEKAIKKEINGIGLEENILTVIPWSWIVKNYIS